MTVTPPNPDPAVQPGVPDEPWPDEEPETEPQRDLVPDEERIVEIDDDPSGPAR